jgi:hypothetical protein
VASAKEWREKGRAAAVSSAVELELPSGMTILARRPDPLQLAAWDRTPLMLAAAVSEVEPAGEVTMQQAADTAKFFAELLEYCCVSPRISMSPASDEEIHPREISQADWMFIAGWAMRTVEVADLRRFRGERNDAGDRGDGEDFRPEAVGAAGDLG